MRLPTQLAVHYFKHPTRLIHLPTLTLDFGLAFLVQHSCPVGRLSEFSACVFNCLNTTHFPFSCLKHIPRTACNQIAHFLLARLCRQFRFERASFPSREELQWWQSFASAVLSFMCHHGWRMNHESRLRRRHVATNGGETTEGTTGGRLVGGNRPSGDKAAHWPSQETLGVTGQRRMHRRLDSS